MRLCIHGEIAWSGAIIVAATAPATHQGLFETARQRRALQAAPGKRRWTDSNGVLNSRHARQLA